MIPKGYSWVKKGVRAKVRTHKRGKWGRRRVIAGKIYEVDVKVGFITLEYQMEWGKEKQTAYMTVKIGPDLMKG